MSFNSFPPGAAIVRFGVRTPFWPLSMSFGMFEDPHLKLKFVSLDHYIGYMMLKRPDRRKAVLETPNGWVAHNQLNAIIASDPGAIDERWEELRYDVIRTGVRLKIEQNEMAKRLLMSTNGSPIFDDSRVEETFFCYAKGTGENQHGLALEEMRMDLVNGKM